jgi:hypothetical protein
VKIALHGQLSHPLGRNETGGLSHHSHNRRSLFVDKDEDQRVASRVGVGAGILRLRTY